MKKCAVTSGYLVEKTFARMWRESQASRNRGSTPQMDVLPEQMPMQYRGLQREPLLGWLEDLRGSGVVEPTDQELEACLFLDELETAGKADWDIIFSLEDARKVVQKIKPPVERETVWARCLDVEDVAEPPAGTVLLGYEPDEFYPPTCYSPIANGLFFTEFSELKPRREQGIQLKAHYDKLNKWGLFDTRVDAEEYLSAFLALFPDEQGHAYYLTEVRALAN